jgi:hypothetical protein
MSDPTPERNAADPAEVAALEQGHIGHGGELESDQSAAQPRQGTCDCEMPACASGAPSALERPPEREAGQ